MKVTVNGKTKHYRTVSYDRRKNEVCLINQRLLPFKFEIFHAKNYPETADAIKNMTVRGAPAIAATAVFGLVQGIFEYRGNDIDEFSVHVEKVFNCLASARPTAVDPLNAMKIVLRRMKSGKTIREMKNLALTAANEFVESSVEQCVQIGEHGAKLIRNGMRILTHCNAGWLACVDIGTATAPLYEAKSKGINFTVFCDETRPRLQGASLTAWELSQAKIPHFVIADNAAGYLMSKGEIDMVIVGSDRVIATTGEVINKIGTYTKAVLAKQHGIPFYVAIPWSSIDWERKSVREVEIEERDESEVLGVWGVPINRASSSEIKSDEVIYVRIANPTSHAKNPGFDITPPEFVTGIITPAGIIEPQKIHRLKSKIKSFPTT